MEKTSVGTKREDCEAFLDGVGLPAKSSLANPTILFLFNFSFFFNAMFILFYLRRRKEKKKEGKIGVWYGGKCTKNEKEYGSW